MTQCSHSKSVAIVVCNYMNMFSVGALYSIFSIILHRYFNSRVSLFAAFGTLVLFLSEMLDSVSLSVHVANNIQNIHVSKHLIVFDAFRYPMLSVGIMLVFFGHYWCMNSSDDKPLNCRRLLLPPIVCLFCVSILSGAIGLPLDLFLLQPIYRDQIRSKAGLLTFQPVVWKSFLILSVLLYQLGITVILLRMCRRYFSNIQLRVAAILLYVSAMLLQVQSMIFYLLQDFTALQQDKWCLIIRWCRILSNLISFPLFLLPTIFIYYGIRKEFNNSQSYKRMTERFLAGQTGVDTLARAPPLPVKTTSPSTPVSSPRTIPAQSWNSPTSNSGGSVGYSIDDITAVSSVGSHIGILTDTSYIDDEEINF
jgi:hypothetical protein